MPESKFGCHRSYAQSEMNAIDAREAPTNYRR